MTICIEIVVLNDNRIFNALNSLRDQTLKPDRILVADGGSKQEFLDRIKSEHSDLPIDLEVLPGLPVETRSKAMEHLKEEITVFMDSDEVAPPNWLRDITDPFNKNDNKLAYTGGPTKPYTEPKTEIEVYLNLIEEHIYNDDLSKSLTYIPLGNTAWRTKVLKELGFDKRLKFEAEDNDIETRAYKGGYYGIFVKEAWLWHDKSVDKNLYKAFRKRYRYLVGAATVFIKNGTIGQRSGERRGIVKHSYAALEFILKPIAFFHALIRWNVVIKRLPHSSDDSPR